MSVDLYSIVSSNKTLDFKNIEGYKRKYNIFSCVSHRFIITFVENITTFRVSLKGGLGLGLREC